MNSSGHWKRESGSALLACRTVERWQLNMHCIFQSAFEKVVLLAPGATVLRPPAEFWVRLMALGIARRRGLRAFFRWIFADMARTDPQWIDSTIEQLSLNMRSMQRHKTPIPPVLTEVETNIHFPTDATLLWDTVRTVTRLVEDLHERLPRGVQGFTNRTRSARRRKQELERMSAAQRHTQQEPRYRELLRITGQVIEKRVPGRPKDRQG